MSELSSGVSELDARLAEIDRRLGAIQAELVPERAGSPPADADSPAGHPRLSDPVRQLAALTELQERLLHSIRALLSAYETVVTRLGQPNPENTVREFTVSAGPFTSTEALRAFEQTLSGISGVREVTVRGYEGGDRAIVDVRLGEPKA
jgi:hypothetical protein